MKNGLFKKWLAAALCVLALGSTAALAEPDTLYLGTGRNGSLTVSASGTPVNIYAQVKATLAPGTRTIPVGSTPGFAAGDLIMVLQSTGIETVPASGDASEVSLNGSQVGRWEFARLEAVSGTTLTLTAPLVYGYAVNVTQVIRVREYTDVTIEATGSIVAQPWDPLTGTGGVVAFLSQGAVTNNGLISATGSGFRGGTFVNDASGKLGCTGLDEAGPSGALKGEGIANTRYGAGNTGRGNVANAGGGGVCLKSGGGGGGNGGAGGLGGASSVADSGGVSRPVGGMGGAKLAFDYNLFHRLTFGGGGGAGHGTLNSPSMGGAGGGIVFIRARELNGATGVISAAGDSGTLSNNDASSGGGGGGSIYLRLAETISCGAINAGGGTGGSTNASRVGPGGGGGGGRLLFQAMGTSCIDEESYSGANPGTQRATTVPSAFGAQTGSPGVFHALPGGFAVPPAPVVSSPTGIINQRRPDLEGTAEPTSSPTEPKTRVTIYVDGIEVGTVDADASGAFVLPMLTDLSDGDHTVQAVAEHYGVRSPMSELKTFTVDTKAPEPVILSGPPALGNSRDVTFDLGVKVPDTGVTYQCRLLPPTGSAFADCTDPADLTVPADGPYTLEVLARDAAGNVSDTPASWDFSVDTTAPNTTLVSGPPERTNATSAPFDFGVEVAEAGVTYECSLDDAAYTSCTDPVTFTGLGDGAHTLLVRAKDTLGNVDSSPEPYTWTVDTTAPNTTLVSGPPERTNATSATFDFGVEVAEAGVTFECSLDGAAFTSCSDPVTFSGLDEREHTLLVRARDALGNVDPSPASYSWTVDLTAPAVPVVASPAPGSTVDTLTPAITGSAEPNSTVTIIIDGTEVGTVRADASGNWSYTPTTPLTTGPHEVQVRATDEAGNSSPTSEPRTFTIVQDTSAPETTITSGPSGSTPERTATFEFSSNEPGVTFECSLDGAAYTPCTSPVTFTDLAEGEHTLQVRARDAAGNVDATPATRTWTVSAGTGNGDIAFLGDGVGCSATGGDASLLLMGLGTFLTLARRRRRRN